MRPTTALQVIPVYFEAEKRPPPPNYFYQPPSSSPPTDLFAALVGPYFFYGTLCDPSLLAKILNLDH